MALYGFLEGSEGLYSIMLQPKPQGPVGEVGPGGLMCCKGLGFTWLLGRPVSWGDPYLEDLTT